MNEEIFAMICYLQLMSHHGEGWHNAHPSYISEKLPMLREGFNAYGRLDSSNQEAVKRYFEEWKMKLPKQIE